MNSYESFDQNVETFNETGDSSEYVWGTEINGFEASGVTSNEQVADFVRNEIPLTHLDSVSDISLKIIEANTEAHGIEMPADYTKTEQTFNCDTAAYIGYELYNNMHEGLSTDDWTKWEFLPSLDSVLEANGLYQISDAMENQTNAEKFAGAYANYLENPNLMKPVAPEHYNFMRDNVFYGREYTDA